MLVKCSFSRFVKDSFRHTVSSSECGSLFKAYSRHKALFMGLKRRWCFFEKRDWITGRYRDKFHAYASINSKLQLPPPLRVFEHLKISSFKYLPPTFTSEPFARENEVFNPPHFKIKHVYSDGKTWRFLFTPPQPRKVQIYHSPGTNDSKIPVGCPGEGDVEASNWSMHYSSVSLSLLYMHYLFENVCVRGRYLLLMCVAKHDTHWDLNS